MYFCKKNFDSVKKSMGEELEFSDLQIGNIDTAFLVSYAVGQFSVGPFGDKYGARRMLIVSLLGGSLGCFLMAGANTFNEAVFAWGLNGFFQAMGFPLVMKALAPWFTSEERGTVLGFWTTSQQVGGTLAASFSGFVAAGGLTAASLIYFSITASSDSSNAPLVSTWREAFSLPALFAALTALAVHMMLVEAPEEVGLTLDNGSKEARSAAAEKGFKSKKTDKSTTKSKSGFLDVVRLPFLLNVGASYFCIKLVRYTMLKWLSFYMTDVWHMDVATASYMSTLFDIGGLFGTLTLGEIAKRYFKGNRISTVFALCIGTGLSALGFLLTSNSVAGLAIAMLLSGYMVAGPDSVLGAAACADVCEQAGYGSSVLTTASGIANGMGSIGAIMSGAVPVLIKDRYGWDGVFVAMTVLSFLGASALVPWLKENKIAKGKEEKES